MFFDPDEHEALRLFVQRTDALNDPLYRAVTKLLAGQPAEGDGEVEFTAKVPEPLFNQFKSRFPQYGATKWFINAALRSFLQRLDGTTEMDHVIRQSIDDMLKARILLGRG